MGYFASDRPDPGPPGPTCDLCGREAPLTFHHLIPRKVHRRARFRRRYDRDTLRSEGLMICRPCHDGIHDLIPDEQQLALEYNTREKLLAHPGIARHVAWVRKQK